MTYAGAIIVPDIAKAKMFGLVRKSDVLRAVQAARQDVYAANVDGYSASQADLVEIVKSAARPSCQTGAKPKDTDTRPAP